MTLLEAKTKFINWWKAQIGYTEGANNWTKYAESADLQRLYGCYLQWQPWCEMPYDLGMIECFGLENASKLTYQPIGQGSAACRYSAAFYAAHGALKDTPEMADQIFFYDAQGEINHTGVVEAVGNGIVYTIEGNKSDRVQRCSYAIGASNIAGYGRPAWMYVIEATLQPADPTIKEPTDQGKEKDTPTAAYCAYVYNVEINLLKKGCAGPQVENMQHLLKAHGFDPGKIDGKFGENTYEALEAFQTAAGIGIDGEWGAESFKAMWNYKNKKTEE